MQPTLYDTHAHVNFSAYKDDGPDVVRRSLDAGVWMNLVGSQIDTSKRAVEYAEEYPEGVYAIVGLHPVHLFSTHVDEEETSFKTREESFDPEKYRLLARSKKVVAIGECGLDYYRLDDYLKQNLHDHSASAITAAQGSVKQKQEEIFKQHIALAADLDTPLMVHCRDGSTPSTMLGTSRLTTDAYDDLIRAVRENKQKNTCGVMHCFLGSWEQAQQCMELGFMISFTGIVTFKNAKEVQAVARQVPLEQMMIETDCPYLTPEPHRGKKRNEPAFVEFVARKIAELKGVAYEVVARVTTENARRLFGV